jgi:hypothetical protein
MSLSSRAGDRRRGRRWSGNEPHAGDRGSQRPGSGSGAGSDSHPVAVLIAGEASGRCGEYRWETEREDSSPSEGCAVFPSPSPNPRPSPVFSEVRQSLCCFVFSNLREGSLEAGDGAQRRWSGNDTCGRFVIPKRSEESGRVGMRGTPKAPLMSRLSAKSRGRKGAPKIVPPFGAGEVPRMPTRPPARDDRLTLCGSKRERARERERLLILGVVPTPAAPRAFSCSER